LQLLPSISHKHVGHSRLLRNFPIRPLAPLLIIQQRLDRRDECRRPSFENPRRVVDALAADANGFANGIAGSA
jgi:hypothetical protein